MEFNLSERYVLVFNLVLIAAIAWFAARAAGDVIILRLASNVVPPVSSAGSSTASPGDFAHGVAYYDLIVKRDIFNLTPASQKPEKAVATDEPLPITLLGTSHLTLSRPYAIVQDQDSNQALYRLGDTIKGAGKLVEVDRDRIVVLHNGHRVAVELPRYDMQGQGPAGLNRRFSPSYWHKASAQNRDGVEKLAANRYIIDRSTVQDKMRNMAQLFTQIRAVPNLENGTSDGFRLSEIQPGSIFQQIGLQDGDILTGVSGQPVTDPAKAMELLEDLRNQRSITLNVTRDGSPMRIFYSIR